MGDLALLLQLHLVENAELREMVREVPQLVTRRVADLSALSAREREIYAAALTRARLAEGSRWLSATRLQGSRLDLDALSALPGWSVDLVDQQDRSTLKPNTHWAAEGVDQEAPSDAQTAVSRFVTGVTFNAIATATLSDFLSRAARGPAEETASALQAWSEASLDALERAGAFTEGEAAGLALVIEDLTPHQARLLGALLAQRGSARDAGMSRERLGDQEQQLQDLFVLTARITGHAIALASNRFQLPPWLVIDALDPTTRHALPYYI
ncbi:hypothetical protein ASG91_00145 [Phycicoccus sp. Soil802]|nr:hypothetical protein ASG91_00145 [Phycicoccus sp. Soil802]